MASELQDAKRIVVKVGTSTLTHKSGKLNFRQIERIVRVLSDLKNAGREIILVTSGAIGVGVGKLGLPGRPSDVGGRQAAAAVGQCELMFAYDKLFSEYGQIVSQILLTRDDIDDKERYRNVMNTFARLLDMGTVPIVNENDTVAVDELIGIHFGDNDTLSAIVAKLIQADALIIFTDIDGLYTADPRKNTDAKRVVRVEMIDDAVKSLAGGVSSSRGTGGMVTKVAAAEIATLAGIHTAILPGDTPQQLYSLLDGQPVGTFFAARSQNNQKR